MSGSKYVPLALVVCTLAACEQPAGTPGYESITGRTLALCEPAPEAKYTVTIGPEGGSFQAAYGWMWTGIDTSTVAEVLYKTTDYYAPEHERTLRWDDPALGIEWPLGHAQGAPALSDKDRRGAALSDAEVLA